LSVGDDYSSLPTDETLPPPSQTMASPQGRSSVLQLYLSVFHPYSPETYFQLRYIPAHSDELDTGSWISRSFRTRNYLYFRATINATSWRRSTVLTPWACPGERSPGPRGLSPDCTHPMGLSKGLQSSFTQQHGLYVSAWPVGKHEAAATRCPIRGWQVHQSVPPPDSRRPSIHYPGNPTQRQAGSGGRMPFRPTSSG
jgi:hypothetical protein